MLVFSSLRLKIRQIPKRRTESSYKGQPFPKGQPRGKPRELFFSWRNYHRKSLIKAGGEVKETLGTKFQGLSTSPIN